MDKAALIQLVRDRPWATLETRAEEIGEIALNPSAFLGLRSRRSEPSPPASGVAVVPITGDIHFRSDLFDELFGIESSVQTITSRFRQALASADVEAIVLAVDSPGGTVDGVDELAAEIRAARGTKPIIAQAAPLMASAAFWLASAADEIVAMPSSRIGSVGVVMIHQEISRMAEADGVTTTIIRSNPDKLGVSRFEPLSEDAKAQLQEMANEFGRMFNAALADGRGVSLAKVETDFGRGRVFLAREALQRGMIDRIGTLDETVARVAGGAGRGSSGGIEASEVRSTRDFERYLREAGFSGGQAKRFAAHGFGGVEPSNPREAGDGDDADVEAFFKAFGESVRGTEV